MSPFPIGHRAYRRAAEARGQQTIVARRHAAALQMAEHERARLLAGDTGDLARDRLAESTHAPRFARQRLADQRYGAALGIRAFRHDDDREMAPRAIAPLDLLAHLHDVVRNLRDENHVGG